MATYLQLGSIILDNINNSSQKKALAKNGGGYRFEMSVLCGSLAAWPGHNILGISLHLIAILFDCFTNQILKI